MGLYPVLQFRLLGLFMLGLFPVGTLSCFASQTVGTHSLGTHSVGTLSCFPTQAAGTLSAGTLSAGTLSVLTASVGTLSCWGSFRSDSFHHPGRLFFIWAICPISKRGREVREAASIDKARECHVALAKVLSLQQSLITCKID